MSLLRAAAFGGSSDRKDGGPTAAEEDVGTFVGALILNWLIGGTDAHAKDHSILLGAEGLVRLAPLYDLASILPYPGIDERKVKLAMKIGGEYRLYRIGSKEWEKTSTELRVDSERTIERARDMARSLPDHVAAEIHLAKTAGLKHSILSRLQSGLTERARHCLRQLT